MGHDNAYKLLFSHREMVEDLLRGFVHEEWVGQLDFSTLEKCNGHYVGDQWRERADDVVWRVRFRGEWLYVYLLLEFQSTPDPWMALRMLVYVGMLYQNLVRGRQLTSDGRLPPVLPLVLYNGVPAWTAPLDLESLLAPAPGGLERYRPSLRYLLLDEGRIDAAAPEALRNLVAALFRLEQGRTVPDLLEVVRPLRLWLQAPEQASLRRAFAKWLEDMLRSGRVPGADFSPIQDLQEAETMLAERVKQWTEEWKREGIQQGIEEGIVQGIEKGKHDRERDIARALLDIIPGDALLAQRTGVPVAEIAAMRREMTGPH
jgi:hypothetical protein